MSQVYLLLGSNIGDRLLFMGQAEALINKEIGAIIKKSKHYESPPWGFEAEHNFLNSVLLIETNFSAKEVLQKNKNIEQQLGRIRTNSGYNSRTIDIDILFYEDFICNESDLIIPHPKLHERRFTLEPLNEIAPQFVHPVFNLTISQLLAKCEDRGEVKRVEEGVRKQD